MDAQEELAGLVADLLATLDAQRRAGVDAVPDGAVDGLVAIEWPTAPAAPRGAPLTLRAPDDAPPPVGAPARRPLPAAAPPRAAGPSAPPRPRSEPRPAPPAAATAPARPAVEPPASVGSPALATMFGGKWAARTASPADLLRALDDDIAACRKCARCDTRARTVGGQGAASSRLLVLTGAPSRDEEAAGVVFTGEAGAMLDKMLVHVLALERGDVHLAAALPCAGGEPTAAEAQACAGWLDRRLAAVGPKVVLAMGPGAAVALGLAPGRHGWHRRGDVEVYVTFHPDELITRPQDKRAALAHLHEVRARVG